MFLSVTCPEGVVAQSFVKILQGLDLLRGFGVCQPVLKAGILQHLLQGVLETERQITISQIRLQN